MNSVYKQKYRKYKKKYLLQKGGIKASEEYERMKKHNLTIFFDEGSNNIWMAEMTEEPTGTLVPEVDLGKHINEFEKNLGETLNSRYYVRNDSLKKLMTLDARNSFDYLEDFYSNLFKGTVEKLYIDPQYITDDVKKRVRIYYEIDDKDKKSLPEIKYFMFRDNSNPCHLIEIIKDEILEKEKNEKQLNISNIKYAFVNIRILGKGKAGTASLFNYADNTNLKIAAKLMRDTEFEIQNKGDYLPLNILYLDGKTNPISTHGLFRQDKNIRYAYPERLENIINKYYPKYSEYNMYNTNHPRYKKIYLSVASDNFTNQTIMHMILEKILSEHGLDNYIKQFDAILCRENNTIYTKERQDSIFNRISNVLLNTGTSIWETLKQYSPIDLDNTKINGLTFMEAADAGDLYKHLYDLQKKYFSKVRVPDDLENKIDDDTKTKISREGFEIKDSNIEIEHYKNLVDNTYYHILKNVFEKIIIDILKPLSILQHPKYAFVHGDLKTKNVFVKHKYNDEGNKIGYIYKIADYDKSSITFNHVRFHNIGATGVQTYLKLFGPSIFQDDELSDEQKKKYDDLLQGDKSNVYKNLQNYIKDKETTMIGILIEIYNYKKDFDFITDKSLNEYREHMIDMILDYELLNKIPDNCCSTCKKFIKRENEDFCCNTCAVTKGQKHSDSPHTKCVIEDANREIYNNTSNKDLLKDLHTKIKGDEKHYILSGLLSKLAIWFPSLETVEFEQLFVRYMPIPFYHTIDLYTLFLSMMQSPMVYTYLRYCHSNRGAQFLEDDIFWKSFRDLWANDDDLDILFGYYELSFKQAIPGDDASIGIILDPIKKNPFRLLKRVENEYWNRVWNNKYNKNVLDKIGQLPKKLSIKLTTGSSVTYPQIGLSECGNFKLNFHRQGRIYYSNKDLIVYNYRSLGEAIKGVMETNTENVKKLYTASMRRSLIYRLDDISNQDLENPGEGYEEIINKFVNFKVTTNMLDKQKDEELKKNNKEKDKEIKEMNEKKNNLQTKLDQIKNSDYRTEIEEIMRKFQSEERKVVVSEKGKEEMKEIPMMKDIELNVEQKVYDDPTEDIKNSWFYKNFKVYYYGWFGGTKEVLLSSLSKKQVGSFINNLGKKENDTIKYLESINEKDEYILQFINQFNQNNNDYKDIITTKTLKDEQLTKEDESIGKAIYYPDNIKKSFITINTKYDEYKNTEKNKIKLEIKNLPTETKIDEKYNKKENDIRNRFEEQKQNIEQINISTKGKITNLKENIENSTTLTDKINLEIIKFAEDQKINFNTDLPNICKTNSYKDFFGNDINWDFCLPENKKIDELIAKILS